MMQTSLVSSGNCVASPLCYSSNCYITQFLVAQKNSLNGYFLQFSLKNGHISGLLDINWQIIPEGNHSDRKEVSSYVCFKSCCNQILIVGSISGQSSMLIIYSTKPKDGLTLSKPFRILKVCTRSQRFRRVSRVVKPSSINLSSYDLLCSPTIIFTALF